MALVAVCATIFATPSFAHGEREPIFVNPAPDTSIHPVAGGDFVQRRALTDPFRRLKRFRRYARSAWRGRVTGAERANLRGRYARLSPSQQPKARRYLRRLRRKRGKGPTSAQVGLTDPKMTAERTIVACHDDSMSRLRQSLADQRLSPSRRRDRKLKRIVIARNKSFKKLCRYDEIQPAVEQANNGDTVVIMPGFYTEPTAAKQPHNDPDCRGLVDDAGAPSYAYHFKCPNDLNLVALIGKNLEGRCIRCNVQILGSGKRPQDVIIEGGKGVRDPGVKRDLFDEGKRPVPTTKEVGVTAERADGAVFANFTARNFSEYGVYSIETDGMTFDALKLFYGQEYGHLSFVTDHNTLQNSEAAGSADAGLYPGAAPPSRPRINTILRRNVSHHNAIGLSGTMGSNVRTVDNVFRHNSTGIVHDSLGQAGHPGFPQNSAVIERNRIYSNNFDTYSDKAWVQSTVPAPIGAGIIFAGGNDNRVRGNRIYDNWKWGTMLISVPDVITRDPPRIPNELKLSTSHRNLYEGNIMGIAPGGGEKPNGVDLRWDELGQGNCWESNRGPGPGGSVRTDPPHLPNCAASPNVGTGDAAKERELVDCGLLSTGDSSAATCDWFRTPPRP
ncbi:MAG: hypothetical protein H0V85_02575, partial [Thermoleophilaceae bacterium]|nr:hypothetical protein [Thermoleophilaceae bacterium]